MKPVLSKGRLFQLFLFVFVDVLGFRYQTLLKKSLILPLIPYYVDLFEMTPLQSTVLSSSNALAQVTSYSLEPGLVLISQFFAAPIIGRLSDSYGRRPLLLLCVAGTLVAFVLLANTSSAWVIVFSRILVRYPICWAHCWGNSGGPEVVCQHPEPWKRIRPPDILLLLFFCTL